MLVELMKKSNPYKDKEGKEKIGTSFYIQCGDQGLGVEPVYYGKENNPDKGYVARKAVMSAFASDLPPLPSKEEKTAESAVQS